MLSCRSITTSCSKCQRGILDSRYHLAPNPSCVSCTATGGGDFMNLENKYPFTEGFLFLYKNFGDKGINKNSSPTDPLVSTYAYMVPPGVDPHDDRVLELQRRMRESLDHYLPTGPHDTTALAIVDQTPSLWSRATSLWQRFKKLFPL